jgi:class 3 adenylate cyclase
LEPNHQITQKEYDDIVQKQELNMLLGENIYEEQEESGTPMTADTRAYEQAKAKLEEGKLNRAQFKQIRHMSMKNLEEAKQLFTGYIPTHVLEHNDAMHTELAQENRQVSTLFCSLPFIGAADFDLAQMLVTAIQKVLLHLGGWLRQFLTDDKGTVCIAVWGCPPFSHHDDAFRACLAAVEIVRVAKDIFRQHYSKSAPGESSANLSASTQTQPTIATVADIAGGVTTANVYCGNVGSVERCEFVVLGDGVNMAARYMSKAMKGGLGVLVDEATKTQAEAHGMAFTDNGGIKVKGKEHPVPSFCPPSADELTAVPPAAAGSPRVFGREKELDMLSQALDASLQHSTGLHIAIRGAYGIGKTHVANAFISAQKDRRLNVGRGRGDLMHQASAYFAWAEVVDQATLKKCVAQMETSPVSSQLSTAALGSLAAKFGGSLAAVIPKNSAQLKVNALSWASKLELLQRVFPSLLQEGGEQADGAGPSPRAADGADMKAKMRGMPRLTSMEDVKRMSSEGLLADLAEFDMDSDPAKAAADLELECTFELVTTLLEIEVNVSGGRPRLLFFDDAQYIDAHSWQLINYVRNRMKPQSLILVAFNSTHENPGLREFCGDRLSAVMMERRQSISISTSAARIAPSPRASVGRGSVVRLKLDLNLELTPLALAAQYKLASSLLVQDAIHQELPVLPPPLKFYIEQSNGYPVIIQLLCQRVLDLELIQKSKFLVPSKADSKAKQIEVDRFRLNRARIELATLTEMRSQLLQRIDIHPTVTRNMLKAASAIGFGMRAVFSLEDLMYVSPTNHLGAIHMKDLERAAKRLVKEGIWIAAPYEAPKLRSPRVAAHSIHRKESTQGRIDEEEAKKEEEEEEAKKEKARDKGSKEAEQKKATESALQQQNEEAEAQAVAAAEARVAVVSVMEAAPPEASPEPSPETSTRRLMSVPSSSDVKKEAAAADQRKSSPDQRMNGLYDSIQASLGVMKQMLTLPPIDTYFAINDESSDSDAEPEAPKVVIVGEVEDDEEEEEEGDDDDDDDDEEGGGEDELEDSFDVDENDVTVDEDELLDDDWDEEDDEGFYDTIQKATIELNKLVGTLRKKSGDYEDGGEGGGGGGGEGGDEAFRLMTPLCTPLSTPMSSLKKEVVGAEEEEQAERGSMTADAAIENGVEDGEEAMENGVEDGEEAMENGAAKGAGGGGGGDGVEGEETKQLKKTASTVRFALPEEETESEGDDDELHLSFHKRSDARELFSFGGDVYDVYATVDLRALADHVSTANTPKMQPAFDELEEEDEDEDDDESEEDGPDITSFCFKHHVLRQVCSKTVTADQRKQLSSKYLDRLKDTDGNDDYELLAHHASSACNYVAAAENFLMASRNTADEKKQAMLLQQAARSIEQLKNTAQENSVSLLKRELMKSEETRRQQRQKQLQEGKPPSQTPIHAPQTGVAGITTAL